jgi:hypothetical protein
MFRKLRKDRESYLKNEERKLLVVDIIAIKLK